LLSGASVTPDHGPVQEVPDADRERNYAERGHRPDVAIRLEPASIKVSDDLSQHLTVAAFGIIPLAVGIGYFLDWSMIRRDARADSNKNSAAIL